MQGVSGISRMKPATWITKTTLRATPLRKSQGGGTKHLVRDANEDSLCVSTDMNWEISVAIIRGRSELDFQSREEAENIPLRE